MSFVWIFLIFEKNGLHGQITRAAAMVAGTLAMAKKVSEGTLSPDVVVIIVFVRSAIGVPKVHPAVLAFPSHLATEEGR